MPIAWAALSSKSAFWARLLFKLVREAQPQRCLELGTNLGISALYLSGALDLNGAGSLTTLEGLDARARLAQRNLEGFGCRQTRIVTGRFLEVLPSVLSGQPSVDFAFVDGHHDEQATETYFAMIAARAAPAALVVFDDIAWSEGMQRAWRRIRADHRVRFAVDLRVIGVVALAGSGTRG
jgi:predicted O-methyltransferase YrrM